MLKIAICGSNVSILEKFEKMLIVYDQHHKCNLKLYKFTKPLFLLDSLKEDFQLYFINLNDSAMNGWELVKTIRKYDQISTIFLIFSDHEYLINTFQISNIDIIKTKISQDMINYKMDSAIEKIQTYEMKSVLVRNNNMIFKLFIKDIIYIETYQRNVLFHCQNKEKIIGHFKMRELEENFCQFSFCRCHNSYIVNINYIEKICGHIITLITGEIIYTTKARKKMLVEKMNEFIESI